MDVELTPIDLLKRSSLKKVKGMPPEVSSFPSVQPAAQAPSAISGSL